MKFYQRAGIFSIILFCAVTLLPVAASASELVGYWKFNESSGDAVDSSGNLPNLTNNNVTYGAGQYGNAAYFNGSTAFFVGTGPDLNGQSFTFSAWLWREAGGGQEIYFSQGSGDGNHNNLHLRVYDDGLMRFGFLNNDLDAPSGTFVMGQWNHVVLTYDAATNARKIYLNGGEAKASDSSISDFIGNTALNIGRWIRNGGDQYWTGRIDDLKIYNRALTLEEVDDLAEGGAGPGLFGVEAFDPADNATGVSLTTNLTATFSSDTVATSTGVVIIYKASDDSLVESIAVSSSQITKSGAEITINPSVILQHSTEYYVWIPSTAFKDADDVFYEGTTASTTWSFTTIADGDAPVISNVATSSIANTGATITWDTDEVASTKVVFGLTSEYSSTTPETDTAPRVTSHTKQLTLLASCTTYHYAVVSRDAAGNAATSTDATLTTDGCEYEATPTQATSTLIHAGNTGTTTVTETGKDFVVIANAPIGTSIVIQVKAIPSEPVLSTLGRPSAKPTEVGVTVFDVKAIVNDTEIFDSFDAEVTIEYEYTDDEISNVEESTLWLYHYTGGQWMALNDCAVDTATNFISCTTPSFSIFGLFGSEPEEEQTGSRPIGGTRFGCKDSNASNYEYFSHHKQELCKYEPVAASVCSPHIKTYIRYGAENTVDDVRKLETFLNEKQGESLAVDGLYSAEDVAAVKRFQEKYASEVLGVWGLSEPTGYVYRTTLMKINSFYCSASITCPAFTEYNSLTENSASAEVAKTKTLLSELGFYTGSVNNTFDAQLNTSLRSFQETFSETMLKPWGLVYGTGYKYKTTNKFLNMLVGCQTPAVELDGKGTFDY